LTAIPISVRGQEKLLALGKYPDVSLALVRKRHQEARETTGARNSPLSDETSSKGRWSYSVITMKFGKRIPRIRF
jgi:hypothetical protein